MSGLPAGLTDPLHLLDLEWERTAGLLAALVALVTVWYLYRRFRRRSPPAITPPPLPLLLPEQPASTPVIEVIEGLRRRHRKKKTYRQGCHELSGVLRTHFDERAEEEISTLTAREIRGRLGDTPVARLMEKVATLQFARRQPDRNDFTAVCDFAVSVVRKGTP